MSHPSKRYTTFHLICIWRCDDIFLFWQSGWTRLLYSTKIKLFPWIPEFIVGFLTSKALGEVRLDQLVASGRWCNVKSLFYVSPLPGLNASLNLKLRGKLSWNRRKRQRPIGLTSREELFARNWILAWLSWKRTFVLKTIIWIVLLHDYLRLWTLRSKSCW